MRNTGFWFPLQFSLGSFICWRSVVLLEDLHVFQEAFPLNEAHQSSPVISTYHCFKLPNRASGNIHNHLPLVMHKRGKNWFVTIVQHLNFMFYYKSQYFPGINLKVLILDLALGEIVQCHSYFSRSQKMIWCFLSIQKAYLLPTVQTTSEDYVTNFFKDHSL